MKFYQYIFYRSYDILALKNRSDRGFLTINFISIGEGFCILHIITRLLKLKLYELDFNPKIIGLLLYLLLLLFNYSIFLRNKKYKKIIHQYKNETATNRIIGRTCILIFIVFILGLFFVKY